MSDEETVETTEDVEVIPEAKPKKQKKVVRRRKTKKDRENVLTSAVRLAVESGKVEFGARTGIAASILGKAKVFVIAANTPLDFKNKIESFAKKSNIPVIIFDGNTLELGSACGKPFSVSVLSIHDVGSSNLLEFVKK